MKKLFIVANWKSNKTVQGTTDWFEQLSIMPSELTPDKAVIICPPFHLLQQVKTLIMEKQLPFFIGSQNVSAFSEGAFTGEIAATQVKEIAEYCIIGHSERRKNFLETDDILLKKVELAKSAGLSVIYCVQDALTKIPEHVDVVAYEPITAIGSGNPDTPENANTVAEAIKNNGIRMVLYGGSVTGANVHQFTLQEGIDGVLVGGASLKPDEFSSIIRNA